MVAACIISPDCAEGTWNCSKQTGGDSYKDGAGELQNFFKLVKVSAAIQLPSFSQPMARDEEAFTSVSSAVNSRAERRQLLWETGEKTDHFSYTNEFTVQSMTFSSPAPSSSPKEIMKVIKYLDVFHMYVSTSYKVEVDQLGELKVIRKDWKRERLQGK